MPANVESLKLWHLIFWLCAAPRPLETWALISVLDQLNDSVSLWASEDPTQVSLLPKSETLENFQEESSVSLSISITNLLIVWLYKPENSTFVVKKQLQISVQLKLCLPTSPACTQSTMVLSDSKTFPEESISWLNLLPEYSNTTGLI